jgi:1-acyl-sn-glycerol-3-phosphate acyltransferase
MKQIPINRDNNRQAMDTLKRTYKLLEEGNVIGVYPEGSRSPDGKIYKGHIGIAHMVMSTDAVVIPISLVTNYIRSSKKKRIPNLMQVRIVVSKPFNFTHIKAMNSVLYSNNNHFVKRAIVDTIMHTISKQSKQDYSDQYSYFLKKMQRKNA